MTKASKNSVLLSSSGQIIIKNMFTFFKFRNILSISVRYCIARYHQVITNRFEFVFHIPENMLVNEKFVQVHFDTTEFRL